MDYGDHVGRTHQPRFIKIYLGSILLNVVLGLGQFSTWAVVVPGQLSYLGSCLPGQLLPGQLSAWAVVAWAVVLAPLIYVQLLRLKG